MSTAKQYRGVANALQLYWRTYGGARAILTSPFAHLALFSTVLCGPIWWSKDWWERSLSIIPAVLGFSIAAFTLLLGVGDETFRRRLGVIRAEGRPSTLTNTSAGLLHFILVQVVALFVALFASSRPMSFIFLSIDHRYLPDPSNALLVVFSKIFRASGFFLLCYALATAVAATLNIFRLAKAFSTYATALSKRAPQSTVLISAPTTTNVIAERSDSQQLNQASDL